jgi:HlyD family secretion protein
VNQAAHARTARRRWIGAATGVLALAGLAGGVVAIARGPRVSVVRVTEREVVQTVVSSGRVAPASRASLGLAAAGVVRAVHVDVGVHVEAGQLLLELEDAEAQAQLAQAQARLGGAQAGLVAARGLRAPLAAQGEVQAAIAVERARAELARRERLLAAGAMAEAERDEAQRALAVVESQARGAAVQRAALGAGGAESRAASAQLAEATAAVAAAEQRLAQMQLVARAPGVVAARHVEPGDVAQPGRVLLELLRDGPLELVITPDEQNLALLREGQPALASADAFPGVRFDARVTRIAPAVDARRGTVEVRLAIPSPPPVLRPEMTVSVEIEVARRARAVALPARLVRDAGTSTPWVLVAVDGRAVRRDVRLGLRGDDVLELAAGVREDELVIDDPQRNHGDRLRVEPAAGAH